METVLNLIGGAGRAALVSFPFRVDKFSSTISSHVAVVLVIVTVLARSQHRHGTMSGVRASPQTRSTMPPAAALTFRLVQLYIATIGLWIATSAFWGESLSFLLVDAVSYCYISLHAASVCCTKGCPYCHGLFQPVSAAADDMPYVYVWWYINKQQLLRIRRSSLSLFRFP